MTFFCLVRRRFREKIPLRINNSRISKREFDISIIHKTKRMLGKLAFWGVLGVFVNERHQDVGADAVLVLFNGWGGDCVRMVF